MDGWTNQQTDEPTDTKTYRVACTRLKTMGCAFFFLIRVVSIKWKNKTVISWTQVIHLPCRALKTRGWTEIFFFLPTKFWPLISFWLLCHRLKNNFFLHEDGPSFVVEVGADGTDGDLDQCSDGSLLIGVKIHSRSNWSGRWYIINRSLFLKVWRFTGVLVLVHVFFL